MVHLDDAFLERRGPSWRPKTLEELQADCRVRKLDSGSLPRSSPALPRQRQAS